MSEFLPTTVAKLEPAQVTAMVCALWRELGDSCIYFYQGNTTRRPQVDAILQPLVEQFDFPLVTANCSKSTVRPGDAQRTTTLHRDPKPTIVLADCLCTEIVAEDIDIDLRVLTDAQKYLVNEDTVLPALPGEAVLIEPRHFHRSAINTTDQPIVRHFMYLNPDL